MKKCFWYPDFPNRPDKNFFFSTDLTLKRPFSKLLHLLRRPCEKVANFFKTCSPKKIVDIDFVFLYFDRAKTKNVTNLHKFSPEEGK